MDFSGSGGPGPGEYNPYDATPMEIENLNGSSAPTRDGTRSFNSKLPRYHEVVVIEEEKKVCNNCFVFLLLRKGLWGYMMVGLEELIFFGNS